MLVVNNTRSGRAKVHGKTASDICCETNEVKLLTAHPLFKSVFLRISAIDA